MQCTACGREPMNPNANYCDYCGTLLGAEVHLEPTEQKATESKETKMVPTWMFFVVMCLPFIPMIGWIAYLGVLLYWGFSNDIKDSKKTFARAMLLYTALAVVLVMTMMGALFGDVMNGLSALQL